MTRQKNVPTGSDIYIYKYLLNSCDHTIIYLFIEGLYCYSPNNRTGSPQGFSLSQILHKLNTIQNNAHIYKRKTSKHNTKISPFGIALVKNGK